jgi:hypothetical protein
MVNGPCAEITKVAPTSVILRFRVCIVTTENTYNADLGNGADGRQATAPTAPIFFVVNLPDSAVPPQPSGPHAHRIHGATGRVAAQSESGPTRFALDEVGVVFIDLGYYHLGQGYCYHLL